VSRAGEAWMDLGAKDGRNRRKGAGKDTRPRENEWVHVTLSIVFNLST